MHVLRVATWNAEGIFTKGSMTRRASPHHGIKVLRKLDADIVVIPEFGVNGRLDDPIEVAIRSLGYQIIEAPYNDPTMPEHVPKQYEMTVLTRLPLRSHKLHHFENSGRAFIETIIELPGGKDLLRVFAVHLDDKAEELRLEQVNQLVEVIKKPHVGETIVLGDFNAMHERSRLARVVRSSVAKGIAEKVPHKLVRSMSQRVSEMAAGTTVRYLLEHTELVDLDGKLRRTISAKQAGLEWAPKIRLAKIDWIFGSSGTQAIHYTIHKDVGSDHRPVIADITLKLHKK